MSPVEIVICRVHRPLTSRSQDKLGRLRQRKGAEGDKLINMLYQLELSNIQTSRRIPIENPEKLGILEKHIEDFFASYLVELIPEDQLMLIAQERKYQEEADSLAFDAKETLFIFELKRWRASAENLLQVLRYGRIFGRYTYAQLEGLVRTKQKLEGKLRENHQEHFQLSEALPEEKFNANQRFVIVTNGIDHDTLEAIQYWSKKGIRIDSLTYKLYTLGGRLTSSSKRLTQVPTWNWSLKRTPALSS